MAAIRCLTGFALLVATAIALRSDFLVVAVFLTALFFEALLDFALLAALRLVAIVSISSRRAR